MRVFPFVSTLLGITLLGAGCAAPAAPAASPAARGGSDCDNAFFPSSEGTTLAYATTFSGHEGSYRVEVQERTATSMKLRYTFSTAASDDGAVSFTQEIRCEGGALAATSYADIASAVSGGRVSVRTTRASGHLLPRTLSAGTTWTSSFDIEATITLPGAGGTQTVRSTINNESRVIGRESVTVPAGTYDAFKVEATLTTESGAVAGVRIPPQTVESTSWFAEGVGMVKTTSDFSGTELVSVTRR